MNETQLPGMQSLARERVKPRFGATRLSISRIADQRMTDMRHMHADLVRAPGREFALDKRCAGKALKNPIAGQRLAPTRHNRHFCPLDRMPADRRIHLAAERGIAMHESKVVTLHGARLELTDEIGLRFKCFGNHQQATLSLSRRCTIPARGNSRKTGLRYNKALSKVPDQFPLPGWTTKPTGLSMTISVSSSKTT